MAAERGGLDTYGAVYGDLHCSETEPCTANRGLNVSPDLAGTEHYVGRTRWDEGLR